MNDGTSINFKELLLLDGHMTITALDNGVSLIVAHANIGLNAN